METGEYLSWSKAVGACSWTPPSSMEVKNEWSDTAVCHTFLWSARELLFNFMLIIAYRIVNGLCRRLMLLRELEVFVYDRQGSAVLGKCRFVAILSLCFQWFVGRIFAVLIAHKLSYFYNSRLLCVCVCVCFCEWRWCESAKSLVCGVNDFCTLMLPFG
jgi:hypothetical protein